MAILATLARELHEEFVINPEVDIMVHADMIGSMMVRAIQDVMGEQLERVECRYPADWWQAVKARWLPTWAMRRWPVREIVTVLEAKAIYPKIGLPEQKHRLILCKSEPGG